MSDETLHPTPASTVNIADEKEVKRQSDKAAQREHRKRVALAKLLQSQGGQEWIWDILSQASVFASTFVRGEPDSTAWQEGQRNIGLKVLADIMSCSPETFIAMMQKFKNG